MIVKNIALVVVVPKPIPPSFLLCESKSPIEAPSGLVPIRQRQEPRSRGLLMHESSAGRQFRTGSVVLRA